MNKKSQLFFFSIKAPLSTQLIIKFFFLDSSLLLVSRAWPTISYPAIFSIVPNPLSSAQTHPAALYANESTGPSKWGIMVLNNLIDNAVRKIFDISDKTTVNAVRGMVGLPDVKALYLKRVCNTVRKLLDRPLKFAFVMANLAFCELKTVLREKDIPPLLSKQAQLRSLVRSADELISNCVFV